MKRIRLSWPLALPAMLVACTLVTGCTTMERGGVNAGLRFAENRLVPPLLTGDDLDMGCVSAEAFAPVVEAVGPKGIGADVDLLGTLLFATAAMCAEANAQESELEYLRATRQNRIEDAQDARILEKRQMATAARREYHAYQHFEHFFTHRYGIEIGDSCPHFRSDLEELTFLMGAVSGLQAIAADVSSQNQVGVPKDIGGRVERAMTCLDNDKWWGMPKAIRAAIWNIFPGGGPEDAMTALQQAARTGRAKGVRVNYAIYAISAFAKDDDEHLKDAFNQYAATLDAGDFYPSTQYRVIDKVGDYIMWNIADRYWTQRSGTRTADGCLGGCMLVQHPVPDINVDDLIK